MEAEEDIVRSNPPNTLAIVYAAVCGTIAAVLLTLALKLRRTDGKQFWHHAVRLPSRMQQPYWYLISISTGCRPWAGHEGDIFLRLVGSKEEGRTFLVNGEVHSRLWEADSHLYIYSSSTPLGEINYVILACRSSIRQKRWYLSSVQIKYVTPDQDYQRTWYFPYHEWIEVHQDPVKVTLCAVSDDQDLNRRLMLGWLGRSFTDFHLWTSTFSPLKYTPFRRNARVACISLHFLGSFMCCVVLNSIIPELGAVVLGLFGSSCAMLPATSLEAVLRRMKWRHKVLLERVKWYKAAEDGKHRIGRKKAYKQYKLHPSNDKMNYDLMFRKETAPGSMIGRTLEKIINDDGKFWNWLDPSIKLPPSPPTPPPGELNQADAISSENLQEEEEYLEEEDTWLEKTVVKLENLLTLNSSESGEDGIIPTYVDGQMATMFGGKPKKGQIVFVGDNFLVQATSMWQVDDDFSIDSLDLDKMDLEEFKTMESMPADEFDSFKENQRKGGNQVGHFTTSEMRIRKMLGNHRHGGVVDIGETVPEWGEKFGNNADQITNSSEIKMPAKMNLLTMEELDLVSRIYYDRCTHGNKWLTKETPLAAVLLSHEDDGRVQDVDWNGVDVDSADEGDDDNNGKYANAFRSDIYEAKRDAINKIRESFPEPVPRERVFSMLMFPDYLDKLTKAQEQMVGDPEAYSVLADLYAEWAECDEGPMLFCEACITISKHPRGHQIVRDIIACARTSTTWTILVCELTQRLRYQGDNVERLKEKYGLGNECLTNARERPATYCGASAATVPGLLKMANSAFDMGDAVPETFFEPETSQDCVYTELQRLSEWRKKLQKLEIALKGCPISELKTEEAKKMSRFYRSMLKTQEGCALFGELLRQITISNARGRGMVSQLIRFVAEQDDGVLHLNHLMKGLGETGPTGRRILIKIYNLIEDRRPSGAWVMKKLANALSTVEMGTFLLKDLQVDAARAHRRAHEVRQIMRRNLDPLVKTTRRSVCQLVMSLNEIAKFMLGVADNARSVLEGSNLFPNEAIGGRDIEAIAQNKGLSAIDKPRAINDDIWNSDRKCCKDCGNMEPCVEECCNKKKKVGEKTEKLEYFELSEASADIPPFVTRDGPMLGSKPGPPPTVSELWKPIDERGDVVNIYRQNAGTQKITAPSHKGFKKPCAPKVHCEAEFRMHKHAFFLQSKDYERFNVDFHYRPMFKVRQLETNFHHETRDSDHERAPCWKSPLAFTPGSPFATNACVKWEKDIKADPKDWGGVPRCKCHEKHGTVKNRLKGEHEHTCLICNIAGDLKGAETSEDIVKILSAECEKLPTKSVKNIKPVPVVERATIQKIHQVLNNKLRTTNPRLAQVMKVPDSGKEDESDQKRESDEESKSNQESESEEESESETEADSTAPMPSGKTLGSHNPKNVDILCQCVKKREESPRSIPLLGRLQRILGLDKGPEGYGGTTHTATREGWKDGDPVNIPTLPNVRPFTALKRRQEPKNVQFASRSPSLINGSQQLAGFTNTKDYEFPVKTPLDLHMLDGTEDLEDLARVESETSILSRPSASVPAIHCEDCGGILVPGQEGKGPWYMTEKGNRKRQGDEMSLASQDMSSSASEAAGEAADTESWKSAMACSNKPGCYGRIPRNSRYRYNKKDANSFYKPEKKEGKKENKQKEGYREWLNTGPCGNVFCIKPPAKKMDKETSELDAETEDGELDDEKLAVDTDGELSDTSTIKYSQSLDPYGMIRDPSAKFPITAQTRKAEEYRELLGNVCNLCKYPKFDCCENEEDMLDLRRSGKPYCQCDKTVKDSEKEKISIAQQDATDEETKPHSTCSQCHVRLGTQQKPPSTRYLLPLKIVRCYENALAKHGKVTSDSVDSGVSMYSALDVYNEGDPAPVDDNEQLILMDLMGLSGRPGVKRRRRRCTPVKADSVVSSSALDNCSICTSTTSSGVCCHMHTARLQPVLHLQGYTCQNSEGYADGGKYPPLSFNWWHQHESALNAMQTCADALVCLSIVLIKDKSDALTDHEQTCKVCSFGGGTPFNPQFPDENCDGVPLGPRYSEFLPKIWRAEIQEFGRISERSSILDSRRPRFYKQLVKAIVDSTKMLLLTPDLRPERLTATVSVHERLLLGASSCEESEMEEGSNDKETYVTTAHVGRLAHFRAMMKCLNDIQLEGSRMRSRNLVGDRDVTVATLLQQQRNDKQEDDVYCDGGSCKGPNDSLIALILNFLKTKACGGVIDCRDMLESPWELPTDQQHITARLLKKMDSVLSGMTESTFVPVDKSKGWEDSLGCIIDAYVGEIVFRATAQSNMYMALEQSNIAKKHMSKLAYSSRMAVARLVRFAELTQAATANLKQAIRDDLATVDRKKSKDSDDTRSVKSSRTTLPSKSNKELNEQSQFVKSHIAALLRTGRDDRRATLDDVLISFERLRCSVMDDLKEAGHLLKKVADLADDSVLGISNHPIIKDDARSKTQLHCWTESDQDSGNAGEVHVESEMTNYPGDLFGEELVDETDSAVTKTPPGRNVNPMSLGTKAVRWKGKINLQPCTRIAQTTGYTTAGIHEPETCSFSTSAAPNYPAAKMMAVNAFRGQTRKLQNIAEEPMIKEFGGGGDGVLPRQFDNMSPFPNSEENENDAAGTKIKISHSKPGTQMTKVQLVEAFHRNIRTLLKWQNSSIPWLLGVFLRLFLFLLALACGAGAGILPFYFDSANVTLLASIPIAIFSHGLIMEPLKCFVVSWILFLRRLKPAFYNNPIFMKSSPLLLDRSRLSHPRVSDEFHVINDRGSKRNNGGDEYYYKFCDNRARTRFFDRRRRTLPVLTENDLCLDLHAVPSYGGVPEAVPGSSSTENFSASDDSSGKRGFGGKSKDEKEGNLMLGPSAASFPYGPLPPRNVAASQIAINFDSSTSEGIYNTEERVTDQRPSTIAYRDQGNLPS